RHGSISPVCACYSRASSSTGTLSTLRPPSMFCGASALHCVRTHTSERGTSGGYSAPIPVENNTTPAFPAFSLTSFVLSLSQYASTSLRASAHHVYDDFYLGLSTFPSTVPSTAPQS